ncbi:glutathione peroxidase [Bacteriovorax sp. BSW11_IV]|uniref:glutathione peroxidase n=1 Tax=Bacteriovorax sp. BSW11_IV TaxID=1353529 RepID=UPI00038A0753|nr:glutathione peroxidase [Bacteriovorax sp. BSW11_IV]EQC44470.1 glutathione peroxidase [Bacteriovorax sp. BSW11_IV]
MRQLICILGFMVSINAFAQSIYDFSLKDENGKEVKFDAFKGKTLLIANIATKCGFTGQLEDLEALYKKYSSQGLMVVGVPSNDFNGQTPEGNKEVVKFCRLNYGVTFPILEKIVVTGKDIHPLFAYLTKLKDGSVKWNFEKFLFNKDGEFVDYYLSMTNPMSEKVVKKIDSLTKSEDQSKK